MQAALEGYSSCVVGQGALVPTGSAADFSGIALTEAREFNIGVFAGKGDVASTDRGNL